MADPYSVHGYSGLFFGKLYDSQLGESLLETAMARVCPCLFYFGGKCKIEADVYEGDDPKNQGEDKKTPCVGAKVRCEYYTCKFKYLVKKYVKDGKLVLAQHVIELFQAYLKHECSYEVVNKFAIEEGVSSSWGEYRDGFNNRIVLPRRVFIEDDEVVSLPYHPESLEYSDYLNFVTDGFFKLLFPRIIYPLDIENTIYQSDSVSVLLDVPGNGYTYVIYISELDLSEDAVAVIDNFFKTGDFVRRDGAGNVLRNGNDVQSLAWFFKQVFAKLWEKQNSDLIVECDKVGFGVSLATLYSKYDLSKCIIVYSENKIIFNEDTFDLDKVSIGMFDISKVINLHLDIFYCDINFASNNIYDLATDYTLDVSYKNNIKEECPKIHADYKGQDLTFGAEVSLFGEGESSELDDKEITTTALPLPWYHSDETTKKYLWKLSKDDDKVYELELDFNESEKEFELGKVIIFKNVIIFDLNSLVFPFYIKDCTYNSYKYVTKYQAYHPMLEYYDVDPDFSFVVKKSSSGLIAGETSVQEQPNPDRTSPQSDETSESIPVVLLKSLSTGVVILVPDIKENGAAFGDTVKLKFTVVKGEKVEYFPEQEDCEDGKLFIPNKCDSIEQFSIKDLSGGLGTCENPVIIKPEEDEDDEGGQTTDISLSELLENPFDEPYYVQINCDLETDEGTGAVYKQADIKTVSYFYFSYLSFKFLFEDLAKKEDDEGEGGEEEETQDQPDYENSDIQKILRGEMPLLSVEDLNMSQEEKDVTYESIEKQKLKYPYMELFSDSVSDFHILKQLKEKEKPEESTSQEPGQQSYDFRYLYETTVRSYINNKFYEPFSVDFLLGEKESETYTEDVKNTVEVKHNLTHVLDTHRCFGLPICGFNENKLDLNNKYPEETEESIFDKLIMENFESEFDKIFYFYIMGISKFVQDYLFFIKYKQSIIPILKRIPVIVSQVGLPDPEIQYKWKSKCNVYTYSYDTGLNPFTKLVDSENLDFFINPFYVIVHKDYREDKYRDEGADTDNRTASKDYGFLFTSNWWLKYKQTMDTYGRTTYYERIRKDNNIFLDIYKTLIPTEKNDESKISKAPEKEGLTTGFTRGKSILYIELESIDYVYSSYCGDHDFVLGNTTPYLYDRVADHPLSTPMVDPRDEAREFNGIYYTGDYDKYGVSMRKARPCSRFVGPMWFPFRACEVARYNEFADYPEVRHFTDEGGNSHRRYIRGFSCTDLIFKPYNSDDTEFSDFKYLFIDDYFGSINPYRYVSSFYSADILRYYEGQSTTTNEIAPTYLASNASVPWRFIPVIYKDGDNDSLVIVKPREFIIGPVISGTLENVEGVEECVFLDISEYNNFKVGKTGLTITKGDQPESGVKRSILYNCLLDIPPMLPYNYNKNKYICGYERMRGGDSSFIYQCLYPYHHIYTYLPGCKCMYDYKNKGEEAYGPIENTLLPMVVPMTTDAEMIVDNSVFFPGLFCKRLAYMPYSCNTILFAYDWLNRDVPYVSIGCRATAPYNPIAEGNTIPWVESNFEFWENYNEIKCETDGPDLMKICLNEYINNHPDGRDFIGSIFIDKNSDCCSPSFVSADHYAITNLKTAPLYYHFASAWEQSYDYVFLGASMKSKPFFYGDGALRMFETYDGLKKSYFIFDEEKEVNNVSALPVFGGLGKFFRMCYFSTNYGPVPFATLSGVNTEETDNEDSNRDDNYVYKLSGYTDDDVVFANDFKYGYLPEKNPVFVTDDFSLFKSIISFTEDDSITLETRDAVCFRDLVQYEEVEDEDGYYKYKDGSEDGITITTFGNDLPIESGPAFTLIYDTSVDTADKYIYYSNYGCIISIAEPIIDDMGVVIDPFPFGEEIEIEYEPLLYNNGYLQYDCVTLIITGLGCCPPQEHCTLDIRVKEGEPGKSNFPWMFYIESEESVVNGEGEVETQISDLQKPYLCYDDSYKPGKLVQKDEDDDLSLSDYDVIKKGTTKYKINRGFYMDVSDMILPYTSNTKRCWLQGLNTSEFFVNRGDAAIQDFCMCVDQGYSEQHPAAYIELDNACFIISLEGSIFLSNKYEYETIVGYLALETSEEYYAVGNLIAYPEFDSSNENIEDNGKYHYTLKFFPYSNYNKVKYGGTKYRLVFRYVTFLCNAYSDLFVDVKYGRFTGGTLCEVTFNKVSSLKAITYSSSIQEVIGGTTKGIDLYNENLNDKLMVDDAIFYAMPFGFVHKLGLGLSEDKDMKFKEGYGGELVEGLQDVEYSENEQKVLDQVVLPVEKDVFKLMHYPTGSIRFCLKSRIIDEGSGAVVNFDMSLVPDLYKTFGYVAIPQWIAPGHKLDLYPDSFYAGYSCCACNGAPLMKAFCCKSCLDIYKNDLDILAKNVSDKIQRNCKELLKNKCGVSIDARSFDDFIIPYNILFVTHVDHGMFGYPDITDVSDWIEDPAKPTVFNFYDKDGKVIR